MFRSINTAICKRIVHIVFQSNYTAISATCNTWRNYKDVQDSWDSIRGIMVYYMNNIGNFSEAAKPGAWNDPDMVTPVFACLMLLIKDLTL